MTLNTYDATAINRTRPGPPGGGAPPSRYPYGSSEWWLDTLTRALANRQKRYTMLTEYFRGTQKLAQLASEAWVESGLARVFPNYLSANYSRLIVNAAAQRLVVLGFRLAGDIRADTEAARIWRANDMESLADVAITESLVKGECPILVEPNPRDATTPIITPQDPTQTIVWTAPGDPRIRLAALKMWWDDQARRGFYTLYLPDRIERWQDRSPGQMDAFRFGLFGGSAPQWEQREPSVINPLGEVPMVVLPNEPLLTGSPEAEHEAALIQIDHYNRVLMDMAVTSNELAFPQRYGIGTDSADEEEESQTPAPPQSARPQTGQSRWITTASPDAQFGQFAAATVDNYVKQLEVIRAGIATVTFTPYHFLLNMPSSVAPSGDAITASDAAPTDKSRGHQRDKGSALRSLMRMSFTLAGDDRRAEAMRYGVTLWVDPERHTESTHIDALGKQRALLQVPREAVWEQIPIGPEEIERWRQMTAEEAAAGVAVPVTPSNGTNSQPPAEPPAETPPAPDGGIIQ